MKVKQTLPKHPGYVVDLAYNATSQRLLSCGNQGDVISWNLAGGKPAFQAKLPALCHCASYAQDGATIAVRAADGNVYLLEVPAAAR